MKQRSDLIISAFKKREKNIKNRKIFKIFLIVISFIIVIILTRYLILIHPFLPIGRKNNFEGKEEIKLLILGLDETVEPARTDTIILANINFKNKIAHLVSIPRDTLVEIPHIKKGKDKINHAYAIGGITLTEKVLGKFLNTKIDYYILTNFEKFKKIIDILGEVEIDVEKRMHYIDKSGNLYIDLFPGKQRLNGEKAMEYVRFRHDALGDIGRIERQQKFTQALILQVKEKNFIKELPILIKEIYNNLETDLTTNQIVNLAHLLNDFEDARVAKGTIPGEPVNINGISYWKPDEEKTKDLITLLLKGIKVEIVNSSGKEEEEKLVAKKLKEKGFRIVRVLKEENLKEKSFLVVHTKEGEVGLNFFKEIKEIKIPSIKEPENKGIDLTLILGKDLELKEGG